MFARLLSTVGLAALGGELADMARRARRRAILTAVAVICWLVAFAFALATLTVWLAGVVGPIAASGILAGAFAAMAILLQLIASATSRRQKRRASLASVVEEASKAADGGTPGATAGLLAVVALAGFLIGSNLFRR